VLGVATRLEPVGVPETLKAPPELRLRGDLDSAADATLEAETSDAHTKWTRAQLSSCRYPLPSREVFS
jgi:hypothetical protein